MPYRYVIDTERRLVISTGWGRLSFADVTAHQDQLAGDPDFNPEFNQLVDARAVTELNASWDEAKILVGRKFFAPTARRAFLGSGFSIAAVAKLLRAYSQIKSKPGEISVFHDPESALKWLGR
jgi:hypothetical protein